MTFGEKCALLDKEREELEEKINEWDIKAYRALMINGTRDRIYQRTEELEAEGKDTQDAITQANEEILRPAIAALMDKE